MKQKFYFLIAFIFTQFMVIGQTTTLPYHIGAAMTAGSGLSATLTNFTTCQTGGSATFTATGYSGSWSSGNLNYYVNNVHIGSAVGSITIDLTPYLPVTSLRVVKTNYNNWNQVDITANITSNNSSMPASGPTVVSSIRYGQGQVATPLSATLTSTGTSLKWYTSAVGDNYSATAPTPNTETIGTTSYWVSQANASGCESVRSKIDVMVVGSATHLNFDGVNDVVNCGNSSVFNATNAISIESWVYPTEHGSEKTIVSKFGDTANNDSYILRLENGAPHFYIKIGGSWFGVSDSNILSLNAWHHVVGVYDGATMKIFINGVLLNTVARTGTIDVSTSTLKIGGWASGFNFSGNIDDVRIWNIARTNEQITNSKNCEIQSNTTGLVAYYKFNQGFDAGTYNASFTTLNDATANANNGTLNNFTLTGNTSNWLSGSVVTSGVVVPAAPVANNQIHCQGTNPTVANLTPAPSSTIKWYNVATGGTQLASTTALTSGTYYASSVNVNGCESERTSIVVTVNPTPGAPAASATQTFCDSNDPTVANLTATGTAIKWYNASSGGSALSNSTVITAGTYYASQTVNGCESLDRTAVTTTVSAYQPTVALTNQVYVGNGTVANLVATGTNLQWYDVASGGTVLSNSTGLVDNQTYYVTQSENGCESKRVLVNAKKIANSPQSFCSPATIGSLQSSPSSGSTVNWFAASTGGTKLLNAQALTTGNYYIEQITPNVQVSTVATGLNQPYGVAVQPDGKIVVADVINNEVKRMNPDGTGIVTLGSGFSYPYAVAVQSDGKILVSDYNNGIIKRMEADGTGIVTLVTGVYATNLAIQNDGKILFSDGGTGEVKRMNADGTGIVVLYTTVDSFLGPPNGIGVQSDGKIIIADPSAGLVRINGDGTGLTSFGTYFPFAIAVQSDDKVLIGDYSGLVRVNADGTGAVTITNLINYPNGIAIESNGNILTTNSDNTVKRIKEFYIYDRLPVSVVVNTTPSSNVTQSAGVLTASQNGATYQWYECSGTLLTGEINQSFTPSIPGDYKVVITNGTCSATSACETVSALAISQFNLNSNFKLYPNPAKNEVTIELNNLTNTKLEVYDINGRLLQKQSLLNQNLVDISRFPSGMYLFKIVSNEGAVMQKVVKN